MASLIPNSISETVGDAQSGLSNFFSNVQGALQTVQNVYDQISGKADGVSTTTTPTKPAVLTTTAPAPATTEPSQTKVWLGLGATVVIVLALASVTRRR